MSIYISWTATTEKPHLLLLSWLVNISTRAYLSISRTFLTPFQMCSYIFYNIPRLPRFCQTSDHVAIPSQLSIHTKKTWILGRSTHQYAAATVPSLYVSEFDKYESRDGVAIVWPQNKRRLASKATLRMGPIDVFFFCWNVCCRNVLAVKEICPASRTTGNLLLLGRETILWC